MMFPPVPPPVDEVSIVPVMLTPPAPSKTTLPPLTPLAFILSALILLVAEIKTTPVLPETG